MALAIITSLDMLDIALSANEWADLGVVLHFYKYYHRFRQA